MRPGRPRTPIGAYGVIGVHPLQRGGYIATARVRDWDGRLRPVTACGRTEGVARARLKQRIVDRSSVVSTGPLDVSSSFADLAKMWAVELEEDADRSDGTKKNYRTHLRLHIFPAFEELTLGEITTGRIERFLKAERRITYSRASHSRTMLNLLFNFALRHDAIARNPVEGTSDLKKPKGSPKALTLSQIAAIRNAAAEWRTGGNLPGPKPDGQVRDIIEVLLGTALRIGECLALRPCDVYEGKDGMIVRVRGTVIAITGKGTVRQDHPKTEHSVRDIPVPEFAAAVLRARLAMHKAGDPERTIFANRNGGALSPYNVRRTFRAFLELADLSDTGISLRWYRRTGATVVARGISTDAAASFLGHGSTSVTEGHYIEPDRSVDRAPADVLERTLRPVDADGSLLKLPLTEAEDRVLAQFDDEADAEGLALEAA